MIPVKTLEENIPVKMLAPFLLPMSPTPSSASNPDKKGGKKNSEKFPISIFKQWKCIRPDASTIHCMIMTIAIGIRMWKLTRKVWLVYILFQAGIQLNFSVSKSWAGCWKASFKRKRENRKGRTIGLSICIGM